MQTFFYLCNVKKTNIKAKELKQILSQFDDDDEVAVRLFGGGLADIYNVKVLRREQGGNVVLLSSYPDLSDLLEGKQKAKSTI